MEDDVRILELFNQGEQHYAFNLLVRKYSERLYLHVRQIVKDHAQADDVLQNAWIRIWRSLPDFREEASLYTWIYRIVTNEALSLLKRERLRSFLSLSDYEITAAQVTSDPYFNGTELQARLAAAVSTLPPKQRVVFVMKYFQEMKYEEIADALGGSVGSLKASYHHAHEKIMKILELEE
ncbi:MAG: RNA polymerase sigma factor [Bacteroidales bacterium]|nr:RNA polymerase sigma factor [Bacteroidales bacterium]